LNIIKIGAAIKEVGMDNKGFSLSAQSVLNFYGHDHDELDDFLISYIKTTIQKVDI
jgi:hypothetical protein